MIIGGTIGFGVGVYVGNVVGTGVGTAVIVGNAVGIVVGEGITVGIGIIVGTGDGTTVIVGKGVGFIVGVGVGNEPLMMGAGVAVGFGADAGAFWIIVMNMVGCTVGVSVAMGITVAAGTIVGNGGSAIAMIRDGAVGGVSTAKGTPYAME